MKKLGFVFLGLLVVTLALGIGQSQASVVDLTTAGASGCFSDGTCFEQIDPAPQGTGVFEPFVRIQANDTEKGYNTDGTPEFDTKASIWTHSIKLDNIGHELYMGVDSYYFVLDINEINAGTKSLITLDALEIWLHNVPDDDVYADGLGTKVYEFAADDIVEMDFDLNPGSGWGDMQMWIPVTSIGTDGTDSVYLYMFSQFGNPNASDDGFEEWAVEPGVPTVPEPSTLLLLGGSLLGLGFFRKKISKK